MSEDILEEGEIGAGGARGCRCKGWAEVGKGRNIGGGWVSEMVELCAELEDDERLFEVVSAKGIEFVGRVRGWGRDGTAGTIGTMRRH